MDLFLSSPYTTILAALVVLYLLVRQSIARPVTRLDFLLPALGAIYIAVRYLDAPTSAAAVFVQVAAGVGIFTGLVAGGMVRVWRKENGLVYQFGGWRYALVLLAFVLVRVFWHSFEDALGITTSVSVLDDGLIALAIGNYLGRTVHVGVRALQLHGWDPRSIPAHPRAARRLKGSRRDLASSDTVTRDRTSVGPAASLARGPGATAGRPRRAGRAASPRR